MHTISTMPKFILWWHLICFHRDIKNSKRQSGSKMDENKSNFRNYLRENCSRSPPSYCCYYLQLHIYPVINCSVEPNLENYRYKSKVALVKICRKKVWHLLYLFPRLIGFVCNDAESNMCLTQPLLFTLLSTYFTHNAVDKDFHKNVFLLKDVQV